MFIIFQATLNDFDLYLMIWLIVHAHNAIEASLYKSVFFNVAQKIRDTYRRLLMIKLENNFA